MSLETKVAASSAFERFSPRARTLLPGLLLTVAIGAIALGLEQIERSFLGVPIIEALVASILIGMLLRNVVALPKNFDAGASYAAKTVLEFAVLMLGATIDLRQVFAAGVPLLLAIGVGVFGGIFVSFSLGRFLGLSGKLALLVAVGNSICGNSAIAAVAPVIRADKKDVASSIALTAVIGVVVVLSLPIFITLVGLSHYQYGILAGMTVYAVPQVIAASFPVSQFSGEVATLVKLVRVLFLGPVVVGIGLLSRRFIVDPASGAGAKRPSLVPWFITGFIVLALLRFIGLIPTPVALGAKEVSRLLTILAMAGLGLGVEFAAVRRVGPRVALAVVGSLIFLITLSLSLILGFGLGAGIVG